MSDEPRLLHARSEHGYTSNPFRAMRDEPEAVSRSEQQRQSLAAERKERARRIAAWSEMRSTVDAALNSFMEVVGATAGHNVVSSVRAIRRSADQLGRRL